MPAAAIWAPRRRAGRLVDAQHERAIWGKGRHQHSQQEATGAQTGPDRPAEHPVVVLEVLGLAQSDRAQGGADHAPAGCEQCPDHQDGHGAPHAALEQGRKRRQQCDPVVREAQHPTTAFVGSGLSLSYPALFFQMVKV